MSPVGNGILSLTKFYRLRGLVEELAHVAPGMTPAQVRNLLGPGHHELADDVVLYVDGSVIDDPLLQACRAGSQSAQTLLWVALVMADHRLAQIVETYLTDQSGRLIRENFNADHLESALEHVLASGARKPATNILSYLRDSGLVEPQTSGNTIVGIESTHTTAPFVRDVVRYIMFRLQHLGIPYQLDQDDAEVALGFNANHWLNLTPEEFRAAYAGTRPDTEVEPPAPPDPPAGQTPPPVTEEVSVEAHNTESYEVSGQTTRTAVRREQPLVVAYKHWMEDRGSEIVRLRFRPPGSPANLYNDIYDRTRNHLIEGKADATRASVRMAIGQLMDYRRFAPPTARLAVLTERRPHRDLEALLAGLDISCVWRRSDGFADNADGAFV
jgi:hypothetical protein